MWLEAVLAVPDGAAVPDDLGDRRHGAAAPAWDGAVGGDAGGARRLDDARPAGAVAGGDVTRRTRGVSARSSPRLR